MSTLVYPEDGLHGHCSGDIDGCRNHLASAIAESNFDIPSDFNYRSYLYGLGGTLNGYQQEINSISSRIHNTDNNLKTLSNNLTDRTRSATFVGIKERDRMIV